MGVNDALTHESLSRLLDELPREAKETMATLAEQYEARGEARGRTKGERELLLRLLSVKFGEVPEAARLRIEAADEARLIRWAERVVFAGTLEDVLGE